MIAATSSQILAIALFTCSGCAFAQTPRAPTRVAAMDYPWTARAARIEGGVDLTAEIDATGEVKEVVIGSGNMLLAGSAKECLLKWRFSKCETSGNVCRATVHFQFRLEGTCQEEKACISRFVIDLPDKVSVSGPHVGFAMVEKSSK